MLPNDARILRGSAIIAAPVGLVATIASAVLAGEKGLIGGLVAVLVVAVFFGLGSWALMRITQDKPQVAMSAGMLVYVVQILMIGIFVIAFSDTTLFSGRAFGLTLLATALSWVGGQVKQTLTSRMLYVDPVPSVPPAAKTADPGRAAAASEAGSAGAGTTAEPSPEEAAPVKAGSLDGA